jgi:hypothetical protein
MEVGQLMRAMTGEPMPDQAKALELRVGQIVRGVVLQLLDGKDALVSLAGVQVRARLETPLASGQSALLQVMPESAGGTIVLRQADAGQAQPPKATLEEMLRLLGLPDKRWAAELALDLRRGGYPVTRETGAALRQAAAARPADVPEEEWMQAAATAWKRGLPVTESTVAALRQAMFGKPLGELLESLRGQLAALAGRSGAEAGAPGGQAAGGAMPAAAARVLALLADGEALLAGLDGRAAVPARTAGPGAPGVPGAPAGAAQAQAGGAGAAAQTVHPPSGRATAAQTPPGPAPKAAGTGAGAAYGAGQPQASPAADGTHAQPAAARAANAQQPGAGQAGAAAAQARQQTAAATGGNWIHSLLKWLGVDYEKQLSQLAGSRGQAAGEQQGQAPSGAPAAGREAAAGNGRNAGAPGAAERAAPHAMRGAVPLPPQPAEAQAARAGGAGFAAGETLKQALLSLAASEDAPAALRETAQQLVQQITGQQLLLAPEKNGALFSHLTLFIPFQGEDGGTTARITIQSRRGRKGELDPDNCRLLFDLQMRHLGDTVVDVQVTDRFVSLNVWNDHPALERLIEASRGEAAEALGRVGYQLASVRVKPFPDTAARSAGEEAAAPPPDPAVYAGKPYRGVDLRA